MDVWLQSLTSDHIPQGRRGRDRMVVEFTTNYPINQSLSPLIL